MLTRPLSLLWPFPLLSSTIPMHTSRFTRFSTGNFFRERAFQSSYASNLTPKHKSPRTHLERGSQAKLHKEKGNKYSTSTINSSKKEFSSNGSVFNRSVIRRDREKKWVLGLSFLPVRSKENRAQDFLGKSINMQYPEAPSLVGEGMRVCA